MTEVGIVCRNCRARDSVLALRHLSQGINQVSMIDHITLPVSNLDVSQPFYSAVLEVLGLSLLYCDNEVAGFGTDHWQFGIERLQGDISPVHVAFSATSVDVVHAFYDTALQAGGADNGAPGRRPVYGNNYYAAFVLDFDGHNIEMVARGAGTVSSQHPAINVSGTSPGKSQ